MRLRSFILALLAGLSASGCAFTLQSPFAGVQGARCLTKYRAKLGDVLSCRDHVWISADISDQTNSSVFQHILEEVGFVVTTNQPPEWSSFTELSVRELGGWAQSRRFRLEIRDTHQRLWYYSEEVASSSFTARGTLIHMTEHLCVVDPWPCR